MKNQDERHKLEPGAAEAILTAEIIKLRSDLKAALDGEYLCPNCAHLEAENNRLRVVVDLFEQKFSSAGWPHEYKDGYHLGGCQACEMLKKIPALEGKE